MTSRAQRKRQKREQGRRTRALEPDDVAGLPRPLRLMFDAFDQFRRLMTAAGGDPAAAAPAALAEVGAAAAEVAALAAPFDAFDVLECVRLSQVPTDPETYRETEHEGSAAVIELVALIMAARGRRPGTAADEDGHRARPDPVIDKIIQTARDAIDVGSMLPFLRLISDPDGGTGYELGAVMREVFVRNLSYEHMEQDTLAGLFGGSEIEADCRVTLGCTVCEIRAVFDALVRLHSDAWQERFGTLGQLVELGRLEMTKARELGTEYEIATEARSAGRQLWSDAWGDPADCSTFTTEHLAAGAGIETTVVDAVLGLFSVEMTEQAPSVVAEDFFAGRSAFRCAPILREPGGSAVVVHHGLLTPAIRERVEQGLKDAGRWERYARHRGDYLEAAAVDLLVPHLPGCTILRGYEYHVPNPRAMTPERAPSEFTSVVEGDALLIVDDVAVIVEGKAGGLDRRSRSGDAQRLYSDLRDIVTSAAGQAQRVRDRIEQDRGLRLRNGNWVDLSHIREIYSIAVSLEDLSGIATVTSELVRTGLLADAHLPWTVSLHDLRIISELVEQSAELLLYLRRRTEPDVTRKFHAVDELDFFLQFYNSGLYVEPDPDRVQAELPQFGEPTVAAKRRFKQQHPEMLTSRTDQLDAWYFHRQGIRHTPAPKPSLNANRDLYAIVTALATKGDPGWLRIGATLLDASGPLQRRHAGAARALVGLSRDDGAPHTICIAGGTQKDNSFVIVWSSIGQWESAGEAEKRVRRYVIAKKHQTQVALGAGLLFDAAHLTAPALTIYDNRRPGLDEDLDDLVTRLGLKPVERRAMTVPRTMKPARTRRKR